MTSIPIFGERIPGKTYVHRPSAYAVVCVGPRFAVARTPVACYLLGGGMDAGETPEQTVVREAQEECGLVLQPKKSLGRAIEVCFSPEEKQYFEKDCFFVEAEVTGRVPPIEVDHELLWLIPEEAVAILTHGSHRWVIQMAADEARR